MTIDNPPRIDGHLVSGIAQAFGLGNVGSVSYLATGLMNRNWKITTQAGEFALKQIIDVPVPTARRNLRVLDALYKAGVPACAPMLTPGGDPVVEIDERGYCVLRWLDGSHPEGPDLTLAQAHQLGTVVGRIHHALNHLDPALGLAPATTGPTGRVVQPDEAIAEARRYKVLAKEAGGPFDQTVVDLIDQRIGLIEKYAAHRPAKNQVTGPYGWTHGDLQYRNIIWRDDRIGAVIDWDRIRVRPFAEEIARTATIQFGTPDGLDLELVSAFVAGYRTVVSIDEAALADGVHRLWWKRMSDFWHLDFHYDRGDYGCDDLFLSGEEVLHWWTSRLDEVQDAFTGHIHPRPSTQGVL